MIRQPSQRGEAATRAERPLRIGDLAASIGVNPKTIRYYEDVGLLPAPDRSASGYRLYNEQDRERLGFIRRAKQVGFSLGEIRAILDVSEAGEAPCERVLALLDGKIQTTAGQLQLLTAFYRRLVELRTAARRLTRDQLQRITDRDVCICGIIEVVEGAGRAHTDVQSPSLAQRPSSAAPGTRPGRGRA